MNNLLFLKQRKAQACLRLKNISSWNSRDNLLKFTQDYD